MPRKSTTTAFDVADYRGVKHYVWRDIPMDDEDEPLRVQLLDLDIREATAIPLGTAARDKDTLQAIAPYVEAWTFRAENLKTGEVIDVPPPAEAGWEVLELISPVAVSKIANWLKYPHLMEGKGWMPSGTTARPSENGKTAST